MDKFVTVINDWPVIVQGALGSALFAFALWFGQKLYTWFNNKLSKFSRNNRKSSLITEMVKINLKLTTGKERHIFAPILLYRMSRPFIKAIIWLVLGLITGNLFEALSVVGYIGSIYYLLKALDVVSAYSFEGDLKERINEINKQLKELKDIDA